MCHVSCHVSYVHRLELENQRLLQELEAARAGGKDVAAEAEEKTKKIHASVSKLEEQVMTGSVHLYSCTVQYKNVKERHRYRNIKLHT